MGKNTFLLYRKRHYHCLNCHKHFYESFSLLSKHCRVTARLAFYAIYLLKSRRMYIPLPLILSIDEFRGNAGGQKFQAILTDAKAHKLFDILPSRSQASLSQYLNGFPKKRPVTLLWI